MKLAVHEKGQYFTKDVSLQESVYKMIKNNPDIILEPSVGRGDLVQYVQNKNYSIKFDLYEIDNGISFLDSLDKESIVFGDFLSHDIKKRYDTIIGNPPYVKTKHGNLYIDFIKKCYHLLNDNGELIFIVPSDFFKLTSSSTIINEMLKNGTFTDVYHPHDENLFDNASVDIIIFRYCKNSKLCKKVIVNGIEKYLINSNGVLTYSETEPNNLSLFSDYFDIYVGMVTGKEEIYRNEKLGNISLLNGKDKTDKYILLDKFPSNNLDLNDYMLSNKETLINRKIRKFNESNWFEWGALRNYKTIKNKLGDDCIYVSNLTRSSKICFKEKVQLFGGTLLIMIPKKDSRIIIDKVVDFMNSEQFKENYMYSGRFKIGHKQLCNCRFDYIQCID